MSAIPLKLIQTMYRSCEWNKVVCHKAYQMVGYGDRIVLDHYGTTIVTIYANGKVELGGGWSVSDRDAINSLLYMAGMNGSVSIRGGTMHMVP